MSLTITDLFCGAGGSSTGAVQIPGVRVRMAANHWKLAVDTHNTNHPDADHACVDLHQEDPGYFPRTDLLWASPECTKWSQANGAKQPAIEEGLFEDPLSDEASQRSRLLMFDVLRFAEHHRYRVMIVENVVDIATQPKYALAWFVWRGELRKLGYRFQVVSLNSMHAQAFGLPAPQSRDRIYVVCWREGTPAPDVDRILRPRAFCSRCGDVVEARQSWKNGKTVGRYRQQYVYVHGTCGTVVEPGWLPAAAAIDWSLPGIRIGDRTKPLADKTRRRIAAGIARYWTTPIHLEAAGNTYDAANPEHPGHDDPNAYYRAWPVDEPLKSMHTTSSKALAVPVEGRDGKEARPVDLPLRTATTRLETALVMSNNWHNRARRAAQEPMPTVTTATTTGLLQQPFIAELRGGGSNARPTSDPLATVTAGGNHHGLVVPAGGTWNDDARPTDEPLRTRTTRESDAIVMPYYGNGTPKPATEALGTVTTVDRHALVMRNNSSTGEGGEMVTPAGEVLRTITTKGHQALLTPGDLQAAEAQVDDVLFRMLEPSEVIAAMAFPGDYVVLGNRREQVRMAGNAVTPPAARDLIAAVVESLTGEQVAS